MKKILFTILSIGFGLIGTQKLYAQTDTTQKVELTTIGAKAIHKQVISNKTETAQDILTKLYSIGLNDLSATDKAITLKSSIFGIRQIFDSTLNESLSYGRLNYERYLTPYLTQNYKNNFDPSNLSAGITISFVNANDLSRSKVFDKFYKGIKAQNDAIDAIIDPMTQKMIAEQPADPVKKKAYLEHLKLIDGQIAKFVLSGDETNLSPDIDEALQATGGIEKIKALKKDIDYLSTKISNRWNITFTPEVTYAFNRSNFQGVSLLFNGIKGFIISDNHPERALQIILQGGYVIGDDTIVKAVNNGKRQFEGKAGLNQVLWSKSIKGSDGTTTNTPNVELGVNIGDNYLTDGYSTTVKQNQPSLNAKLGFLLGEDSWLILPFTYNFATKTKYAFISVRVNLGNPPFKSQTN